MRVKAYIKFRGKFRLTYIGKISKRGIFKFRNKQLRKAVLNHLKDTFSYDCLGGSLTIPDKILGFDKYITCYDSVVPIKENSTKYIVTYWKK